jgi:hypothetical protein
MTIKQLWDGVVVLFWIGAAGNTAALIGVCYLLARAWRRRKC